MIVIWYISMLTPVGCYVMTMTNAHISPEKRHVYIVNIIDRDGLTRPLIFRINLDRFYSSVRLLPSVVVTSGG